MGFIKHSRTFRGGIHPNEQKELSENLAFETMPFSKQIIIPLSQHAGKSAKCLVKKGSEVKAGEIVAEADGFISSPIHSPVSGKVTKIISAVTPNGTMKESIIIEPNDANNFEF